MVDVHQDYLNNLLVFYKLNPTPFLDNVRNISYEFLRLFDNICNKYGLGYWLDYSTLLGAVRHDDFIPWDGKVETLSDALESSCKHLNLSLDKTDYFIGGVDGGRFVVMSPFKILKTENLIPLKRLKFGPYEFSAPNNSDNYLSEIYGKNYMEIGRTIKEHGRLARYKKYPNIMEKLNQAK